MKLLAAVLCGPIAVSAQQSIAVRTLSAPSRTSVESFGLVFGIHELSDHRVVVNDGRRRRMVLLDSTLSRATVVLDTAAGRSNSYGGRSAPIIPYRGDTTLFVDLVGQTLLVIEPDGRVGRSMAVPSRDVFSFGYTPSYADADGRIVYKTLHGPMRANPQGRSTAADSLWIIRADLDQRRLDTLAMVKNRTPMRSEASVGTGGQFTDVTYWNPVQTGDEWVVTATGSVAVVRGVDYHIDWFGADGSRRSTPRMPFDWRKIGDAERQHLIDSTLALIDRTRAARAESEARRPPPGSMDGRGNVVTESPPMRILDSLAPANEIPDYHPPLGPNSVLADRDGNVWILPATSSQSASGELVYDVVNAKGELFERVRLPKGASIAGFGRNNTVYLMTGTLRDGFALARTTVVRN